MKTRTGIALLAVAASLGAQSRPAAGVVWHAFRSPDSSFAVMFPDGQPFGHRIDSSTVGLKHVLFYDSVDKTSFAIDEQESADFAHEDPLTTLKRICASCGGGMVLWDSSLKRGNVVERHWRRVLNEATADQQVTAVERAIVANGRLYRVSAFSQPGEWLPPIADWFVTSFATCGHDERCLPAGDPTPARDTRFFNPEEWHPKNGFPIRVVPKIMKDSVYIGMGLDKNAKLDPKTATLVYPPELKSLALHGEVEIRVVVDTLGVPELNSFEVVKSTHPLFSDAVKAAMVAMRFSPAELQGVKVRQQVQMIFTLDPH